MLISKYRPTRPVAAEFARNHWEFLDFPPETSVQDLLEPAMWANVSRQWFKPLDEIVVIPTSAPFKATFIVLDKGDTWAKLRLLDVVAMNNAETLKVPAPAERLEFEVQDAPDPLPEDAPIFVKWLGPVLKHSIVRKADSERLKTGFAIRAEAEAWAARHIHAMA